MCSSDLVHSHQNEHDGDHPHNETVEEQEPNDGHDLESKDLHVPQQNNEEKRTQHYHHHDEDEPFCCMLWLKMVFMAGYATSQFLIGLLVQKTGLWSALRISSKGVIVCGMIASVAGNFVCISF